MLQKIQWKKTRPFVPTLVTNKRAVIMFAFNLMQLISLRIYYLIYNLFLWIQYLTKNNNIKSMGRA